MTQGSQSTMWGRGELTDTVKRRSLTSSSAAANLMRSLMLLPHGFIQDHGDIVRLHGPGCASAFGDVLSQKFRHFQHHFGMGSRAA